MPQETRGDWPDEPIRLWESLPEGERKAVLGALSSAGPPGRLVPPDGIQRALAAGAALTGDVLRTDRTKD